MKIRNFHYFLYHAPCVRVEWYRRKAFAVIPSRGSRFYWLLRIPWNSRYWLGSFREETTRDTFVSWSRAYLVLFGYGILIFCKNTCFLCWRLFSPKSVEWFGFFDRFRNKINWTHAPISIGYETDSGDFNDLESFVQFFFSATRKWIQYFDMKPFF